VLFRSRAWRVSGKLLLYLSIPSAERGAFRGSHYSTSLYLLLSVARFGEVTTVPLYTFCRAWRVSGKLLLYLSIPSAERGAFRLLTESVVSQSTFLGVTRMSPSVKYCRGME
jgi:hypothetical protein